MHRFIVFFFLSYAFVAYGQNAVVKDFYLFENLKANPSFPGADNLIDIHRGEIFILHNAKRPYGLDYDSLILYRANGDTLEFVQNLSVSRDLDVSYLRSFHLSDSLLFFTDNNGVFLFENKTGQFGSCRFVQADNTVNIFNSEFGRFEVWHQTERGIFTTDFHYDLCTKAGRKMMQIAHIGTNPLKVIWLDSVEVTGNHISTMNAAYPFAFNPSGERFAMVDIPHNELKIFGLEAGLNLLWTKIISDSFSRLIIPDSVEKWSVNIENGLDYDINRSTLSRHVLGAHAVNRLLFVNDSMLLIESTRDKYFFQLMNINTGKMAQVVLSPELDMATWYTYSAMTDGSFIYVLTPNKIYEQDGWQTKSTIKGWKLYRVAIE